MSSQKPVLAQKYRNKLTSTSMRRWLDESVLWFDGVRYTRHDIAELTETTCTNAAANLQRICTRLKIGTVKQLHAVGIHGLRRIAYVGERTALIAVYVIAEHGLNIDHFLESKGKATSWTGAVAAAKPKRNFQKHE